jgi:hypothetical protein
MPRTRKGTLGERLLAVDRTASAFLHFRDSHPLFERVCKVLEFSAHGVPWLVLNGALFFVQVAKLTAFQLLSEFLFFWRVLVGMKLRGTWQGVC